MKNKIKNKEDLTKTLTEKNKEPDEEDDVLIGTPIDLDEED